MEHGKRSWLVADCYWPEITTPGEDAQLAITLYFEDREPMTGFTAVCGARRTHHVRMDKLVDSNGAHVPMGVPYAALVESNVPVICQYSRIDTTQVNETFGTTMMY